MVVCKSFFLETLGFRKDNDSIITKTFSNDVQSPCVDRRGKHASKFADVVKADIRAFIEKYNPQASHYCREKAPKRRYLPKEITVKGMFSDFREANPGKKVSYSMFYSTFKSMSISITQLGNEECEKCEEYKLHKKECNCIDVCTADGVLKDYLP